MLGSRKFVKGEYMKLEDGQIARVTETCEDENLVLVEYATGALWINDLKKHLPDGWKTVRCQRLYKVEYGSKVVVIDKIFKSEDVDLELKLDWHTSKLEMKMEAAKFLAKEIENCTKNLLELHKN